MIYPINATSTTESIITGIGTTATTTIKEGPLTLIGYALQVDRFTSAVSIKCNNDIIYSPNAGGPFQTNQYETYYTCYGTLQTVTTQTGASPSSVQIETTYIPYDAKIHSLQTEQEGTQYTEENYTDQQKNLDTLKKNNMDLGLVGTTTQTFTGYIADIEAFATPFFQALYPIGIITVAFIVGTVAIVFIIEIIKWGLNTIKEIFIQDRIMEGKSSIIEIEHDMYKK